MKRGEIVGWRCSGARKGTVRAKAMMRPCINWKADPGASISIIEHAESM